MTEAIGLDQTGELAGQRKEHRENQAPAGVDGGRPPLSEPHFLYVPVGNRRHALRVRYSNSGESPLHTRKCSSDPRLWSWLPLSFLAAIRSSRAK